MQRDFAKTFINIFHQQGRLPRVASHGMRDRLYGGQPRAIVLADLTMKGFVDDKGGKPLKL